LVGHKWSEYAKPFYYKVVCRGSSTAKSSCKIKLEKIKKKKGKKKKKKLG
jgi:hypothetical protein